jgi:hypothetical protein
MVHIAQEIREDSWLHEDRFAWFRKGHGYASTQTRAFPALSQVSPEALYFAVSAIMRGAGMKIPDETA